ncbi:MAG: cell division protein FtsQ [Sulfitobacter sp.]|nr:cell division protein FtsQ [Sulfitobacter sp.]
MLSLIRSAQAASKADPAPSRWAWRMQRLMLTPGFRLGLRAGVPFCLTLMAGTIFLSDPDRRAAIADGVAEARASIEERPEFMVKVMAIDGAEGALAAEIRAAVPIEFPLSSFDLNLEELRADITAITAIKKANVRIKPGGILQIDVTQRTPVVVWRHAEGLALIDRSGAHVTEVARRADHPTLPLIAGEGAARRVPEALKLVQAASALGNRLRGLVRVGERRWDVVLDRDQRILLPEKGALQALERVIALESAEEVLTRDVTRVDLRLARRPTVRMSEQATQIWWEIKGASGQ